MHPTLNTMDQTPFQEHVNLIFFLLVTPILVFIFKIFLSPSSKKLPPGPRPWPIIGNILQMGTQPHISMTQYAQLHGPLISLKFGTQLAVVGSSPSAAAEILKTHDRLLSARSIPEITNLEGFDLTRLSLIWSDCTERWKFLRGLCRTELFSVKALEATAAIREKKVNEMVEFLCSKEGQVVNIGEVVSTAVNNSITNLFFSKDLCYFDNDVPSRLKDTLLRSQELVSTPNLADLYPVFARFDLQGLKKKGLELSKQLNSIWEDIVEQRRENHKLDAQRQQDFLDVLLANGFEDDQINYLIIELFSAATDTTTTTVEWAMTELVKNKEAMRKVGEELTREIKEKDSIKESDLSQFPYLLACVMETLRLHPPVPLLLPHKALETCQVMSYTIPKETRIFVNVYAIGRDPVAWEDPLSFKPERFLDSKIKFQGQDFEYLPFGSGRRMCPGQSLGVKQVVLFLAHLVHCFDWYLPNDEDPIELDMSEKLVITLRKEQPLCLIPRRN